MAFTNAEKQRRYRERQKAKDPRMIEAALLAEAERRLSDKKRIALADKIADAAMDFQWRAIRLSKLAYKLRTGEEHPHGRTTAKS
jgi:hypothetical protein